MEEIKDEEITEQTIVHLNALVATTFMLSCLDQLEKSPFYRHALKYKAKQFRDELMKRADKDLDHICGIEDDTYYNIMEQQEGLLKEIATMRPDECEILREIIRRYKMSPEGFRAWLGIKIIKHEEKHLIEQHG